MSPLNITTCILKNKIFVIGTKRNLQQDTLLDLWKVVLLSSTLTQRIPRTTLPSSVTVPMEHQMDIKTSMLLMTLLSIPYMAHWQRWGPMGHSAFGTKMPERSLSHQSQWNSPSRNVHSTTRGRYLPTRSAMTGAKVTNFIILWRRITFSWGRALRNSNLGHPLNIFRKEKWWLAVQLVSKLMKV